MLRQILECKRRRKEKPQIEGATEPFYFSALCTLLHPRKQSGIVQIKHFLLCNILAMKFRERQEQKKKNNPHATRQIAPEKNDARQNSTVLD